ncbi:hypothetical protein C8Q73DRAFT_794207 [Cubamyces lactineus]|nr:hypothetical protein C8Q73DRAFT_794207 [Cubamyces lactineus]
MVNHNHIVPLSLDEFYDIFLPVSLDRKSHRRSTTLRAAFSQLDQGGDKLWHTQAIVDQFKKVVNDPKLAPGLKLDLSPHPPVDPEDGWAAVNQKIDGALFHGGCKLTNGRPNHVEHLVSVVFKGGDVAENDPFRNICEKASLVQGPEPDTSSQLSRAQFTKDAEKFFSRQPRTHLFTLFVVSRYFRIMRWDHSGVVITPPADYVAHPELLYEFLWRVGRASKAQLGFDPTATLIKRGSPEYKLMDQLSQPVATDLPAKRWEPVADGSENNVFEYVRTMFRNSLAKDWPRWKLSIPQVDGSTREFLVGKPCYLEDELIGRATRGYVAVDPAASEEKKKFVWLKDTWRILYGILEAEGVALEYLKQNANDLFGIPTLVCHGDLPGQSTLTPDIWEKIAREQRRSEGVSSVPKVVVPTVPANTEACTVPSTGSRSRKRSREDDDEQQEMLSRSHGAKRRKVNASDVKCPLQRHVHYRIVVEEVGRPLKTFENGHHLVSVIYDCIKAHRSAAQVGILHRDISRGNILIYPTVKEMKDVDGFKGYRKGVTLHGLLTDWELAMDIKESDPRRHACSWPYRLGTWNYMSIALIHDPAKTAEIADELESFFYILLYYAVRFLKSRSCADARAYLESFFDDFGRRPNGEFHCGVVKMLTVKTGELLTGQYPGSHLWFSPAMNHILLTILRWMKARYLVYWHARSQEEAARSQRDTARSQKDSDSAGTSDQALPQRTISVGRREMVTSFLSSLPEISICEPPPSPDPTSEDNVKDAQKLSSHDDVLALLLESIGENPRAGLSACGWSIHDKVPDRYRT